MKDEYDFSYAERGRFFVPLDEIELPVYLDRDIIQFLNKKCDFNAEKVRVLINDLLRKDIEIFQSVA